MRAVSRADVRRIYLEVASDNAAALRLYTKSGFTQTGLRKGYYARTGHPPADAVTMARTLT
jgi:ribosomal-protein-alanine N-acetyltransferase